MTMCNCVQCGQLFISAKDVRCKSCVQLHLNETRKVKDYVQRNPKASLMEVYNHTGVPIRTIKELISS